MVITTITLKTAHIIALGIAILLNKPKIVAEISDSVPAAFLISALTQALRHPRTHVDSEDA